MRARLRDSVCLLIAIALAPVATAAQAGEQLVMPYTCSVMGGEVVLRPSASEGYRIVSPREDRDFTACSPVDPSMCRKWRVHRFDIDCGGERVPWTSVVAAADKERSAWEENGRLQIRMPSWWTAGGEGRPGDEIVQMPYGFAPKFGLDASFVADDGQGIARSVRPPQVGGYSSTMAPGAAPRANSDFSAPSDTEYAVQPGSALPPVGAAQPGAGDRLPASRPPLASRPRNIPFEIKPPEEGLTVESEATSDTDLSRPEHTFTSAEPEPRPEHTFTSVEREPRPEHTFASVEPEPEPEMTWREPPPLPEQLDPVLRRQMARGSDTGGRPGGEMEMARAAAEPAAPAAAPDDPGKPTAAAIINSPPAASISSPDGSSAASPVSSETASSEAETPGQQPVAEASGASGEATVDDASGTAPDTPGPLGDTSQSTAGNPEQLPAFSNEANAAEPPAPPGLVARVMSGEPAAVAVTVIAGGLLAILGLGLCLRRRQDDLPDLAQRDISSVSLDGASAQPSSSTMMHDLGAPTLDPPPSGVRRAPSLDAGVENAAPKRPAAALPPTNARRDPGVSWGEKIPRTHAEALRVLGMGVTREASPASIKKVVDGLRMSWHPDYAEDEADRRVRELRMKQINAAWEIISGSPARDPEPARRPEKLHQL